MERKERLEKILNKSIGNPNHDKEGKFTFAPYKKYPGLQQSVKKLITIKKAEKGLTEKYLKAVDEEREKLFKKYNQNKELEDDELSKWNDGWYMWDEKDKANFSDIDIALSKAIFKESKQDIDVYRTQVDSKNPGKMSKSKHASWSPDLEYVCKWARFLAGYNSKIDIFKNKPTLENIKIIPDVLYSQRFLRNKAKYQEYVLENKSSIEAFEHDLSRHDVYEKYTNSIDLISKDLVPFDFYIKYNGGPGSGNFNPGQGRGIGKPTNGIKFSKSVNNYFKTANKDSVNTLNEEIKNAISDGLDLSDVKFEIVDSLGNTNGQVVTDDAETMNPKFTLRFEKSVFNNFYPKENDKEIYKWSGQADSSTRGMIRHELGHLFHFKKSLQAGITPDIADDFAEFIVRKEADKLGIDLDNDKSNDNFSKASRMDYGEFIAESYSRPDYSNLTQNVVDAFKNNKYSKEDYSKYLDEDLENLMKMEEDNSIETNGGPGSGNFNPGQGRGVGKPSNKSKKLTYEEYAEKFKKLTRSEKEELDKEYPEYADRYFKELVGRHIQRERDEKSFGIYEKDNSHPHFDLDKVPTELKYALDITPTQGLKKYDPKTQTLIDLKNRKEYYNEEKGIWVRVISMSPRDYSNTIIENNNGHYTSMREIEDRTSKGGIDMYVEKFKNRERQEVPYIKFNKEGKFSGEQEGFHRSFAADEIGDKEIPVLIVTDYYGKQPFLNHGRDITKDVENYYASNSNKNSLTRNQRLDLMMNGGPGSGNFNPGQGRGVGKPNIKTGEFVKSSFPSLKMSENSKKFYEKLNPKIQESFEKCVDRLKKTNISLDNVELEFVNSNTSGGDNGWVNVVDGDNIDSKMIVNLIKPVLKKFTKKEQDVYKHSFVADNSSEAIIDHEFGHIVMYKKAAEIGIKPKSAHLFAEMIVKNEAKKLNIDLNDKSTENFSEYAHRNYTEFIAEAYSRPDYSKLTQNVSDSLLNNKYSKDDFKNFIMEFSGIQTSENNLRINRLVNLEKILNGGKGSGNFNPGQGRGVGKPANGSNKSFTTFSVDSYSKERLNKVLEKYGVATDTNIGVAISNAAWQNGNKEDYKRVEKILEERYGEDWYDNDEAEKDADYLEYLERKAKRIEELQKKIYSELGIEFDPNSFWVSKDTYDGIQKAIKEGKLKEFINGDALAAKEDPNFVRDPETAIGFYRQKSFNFDNGNFNVEMMTSTSESGYSDILEDNFINKSDYDNFMKRKMVKVNNDEVRSWYTMLDKSGTYPPISRAEERSLQEYNLASAVNQQLREGKTSKTAENIASAIDKKYSHSNEVYRGVRGDFAKEISSLKKGDTVTDKGFMSTSSIIGGDDSGAAKFGKTIMKIKTKSGFGQSIDMAPYVKDMRYLDEGEILLQKDTTIKYTGNSSKTTDKDGNDIIIYEFEVE